MDDPDARRRQRLDRYDQLRAERPAMFANPPGAPYEIVFDRAEQLACGETWSARLRAEGRPAEHGEMGVVYEDGFFIAVRDTVRFSDGRTGPYFRLLGAVEGTGAAALPMLADGRLLIIRHFRHEPREWLWEIPRGFAEPGEDGAATAVRELAEEIGVQTERVELLGRLEDKHIYLARLDRELPGELTSGAVGEGIDHLRLVTPDELAGLVAGGEVADSFLLAAYAFARARGLF
jgi:ADP-ribose pyrophosphatase